MFQLLQSTMFNQQSLYRISIFPYDIPKENFQLRGFREYQKGKLQLEGNICFVRSIVQLDGIKRFPKKLPNKHGHLRQGTVPLPSHGPKLVPQHGQGRGASERGLRHGKSPFLIGKPSINGPFSTAMLNNQRVTLIILIILQDFS